MSIVFPTLHRSGILVQQAAQAEARGWWIYALVLALVLALLGWLAYKRWAAQVAARDAQQRTARSRSAARRERPRASATEQPAQPTNDDELLRSLLEKQ